VEFRRALDDDRFDTGPLERDRRTETTYPGSNDGRAHVFQRTSGTS
jgi:hypothetical protein